MDVLTLDPGLLNMAPQPVSSGIYLELEMPPPPWACSVNSRKPRTARLKWLYMCPRHGVVTVLLPLGSQSTTGGHNVFWLAVIQELAPVEMSSACRQTRWKDINYRYLLWLWERKRSWVSNMCTMWNLNRKSQLQVMTLFEKVESSVRWTNPGPLNTGTLRNDEQQIPPGAEAHWASDFELHHEARIWLKTPKGRYEGHNSKFLGILLVTFGSFGASKQWGIGKGVKGFSIRLSALSSISRTHMKWKEKDNPTNCPLTATQANL